MTGAMYALGPCYGCGYMFTFSVERVPAVVAPDSGEREPICADCVTRINPIRVANGLEPIVPLPGAYDPDEV